MFTTFILMLNLYKSNTYLIKREREMMRNVCIKNPFLYFVLQLTKVTEQDSFFMGTL